ncbi:aliphatic sulfonate ABC transporter substrate-binding protein [Acinetobacter stercoris]|uniref:Putative aliphatic sulfonates-binding protein n=1 Tax=Acinetobacter stercoris TaxID=2126983 RepID=A0A2U3MWE9_9GAMM|nr:aliphatic sulfonate ABC transporter substrate-binding protein [Acinetobacter stercoris]SPL69683.1 putative aliphatic sulfonates-binding protein precursor [Acinetobacter stercoris]
MKKILATAAIVTLSINLAACEKKPNTKSDATGSELKTLTIGYQKASLKLIVAKKNKIFEQAFPNTKIEWKEFPAGPQTLEALNVGAIDVGYTGDTPVIFALSAGKPIQYLAYEINSKNAHNLLIPKTSNIKSLQDLKGKRIGLTKGSSAHYFLAEVLKKANLTWQDIEPIWLTPADGRAALDKQSIDAWAIWDPYSSAAALEGSTRVLIDAQTLPAAYSFYLSSPKFLQTHPVEAQKFISSLNQADTWINANPEETTKILAESTGIDLKVAERVMEHRNTPSPVSLLDEKTVQDQQKIADLFSGLKLVPNAVQIKEHSWKGGE